MATETETSQPNRVPQPPEAKGKPTRRFNSTGGRPRPGSSFELYSWYFFRVSGLLLLFFALGHLLIMHLLNNVDVIDYKFIVNRWASPLWRTFDLILLFLSLAHGVNGARVLVYDYIQARGWRTFALGTLYSLSAFFLIIGTQVIFTFQPQIQNLGPK